MRRRNLMFVKALKFNSTYECKIISVHYVVSSRVLLSD